MNGSFEALFSSVKMNPPASEEALAELSRQVHLPDSYLALLMTANGLEGELSADAHLRLWKAEDLVRRNEGYGSEEFTPGLFLIGSDGADTAYGLDIRPASATYGYFLSLPFITVGWNEVQVLGSSFEQFIEALKTKPFDAPAPQT